MVDAPSQDSFEVSFNDIDPCTGDPHMVTFNTVLYQHHHDDRFVEQGRTEITTTPTGYVGRGTHTLQDKGQTLAPDIATATTNAADPDEDQQEGMRATATLPTGARGAGLTHIATALTRSQVRLAATLEEAGQPADPSTCRA